MRAGSDLRILDAMLTDERGNQTAEDAVNQSRGLFEAQQAVVATGITKSYDGRVPQLDCMGRVIQGAREAPPTSHRQRPPDVAIERLLRPYTKNRAQALLR
jgi:hypothetical protein